MSARPMVLHIYRSREDWTSEGATKGRDHWRWRIRATNGRIIADSAEAYGRLQDAANGAELVTGLYLQGIKPGDDVRRHPPGLMNEHRRWRIKVDSTDVRRAAARRQAQAGEAQ